MCSESFSIINKLEQLVGLEGVSTLSQSQFLLNASRHTSVILFFF
jgi:hypothetical protein